MHVTRSLSVLVLVSSLLAIPLGGHLDAEEWGWRGPTKNGHAAVGQSIPDRWSETENVIWVTNVPGRGHSSPIIAANRIFLTTADENAGSQSVLCFDFTTGESLWSEVCHEGVSFPEMHSKNTAASSSVAIGDQRAYAVFCNNDSVHVTCLSFDGKRIWQKRIADWIPARYQFGFGQSPIFHDGKLIVTSESEADPFIMALDPSSGEQIWKIDRPVFTTYSTPVVTNVGGREQLLISGGRSIAGYDPASGAELWFADAEWVVTCGTMVWHPTEPIVYASGGYPTRLTYAIKADGSADIVWENNKKCYEQSLIVVDDSVYGHAEGGVLYCWDALTGKELWNERLGGAESASPVFADGKIHFSNEEGTTWVIRPNRNKFDLVSKNQLEEEMFASMAVHDNRMIMRVADEDAGRQERLYCIGKR